MAAQYLTLVSDNPLGQRRECGPFERIRLDFGARLYVNDSIVTAAWFNAALPGWIIADGAELGDETLTGQTFPIILGQAK